MQSLCLLFDTMTMGSNIEAVLKQKPSTVWKKEINNQVKSSSFDVSVHFRTQWLRSMLKHTCSEVYMYIRTQICCWGLLQLYVYICIYILEIWSFGYGVHNFTYMYITWKYTNIYIHMCMNIYIKYTCIYMFRNVYICIYIPTNTMKLQFICIYIYIAKMDTNS